MSGIKIKNKSAFTIIELMLVIVIIGIVYLIAATNLNLKQYSKEKTLDFKTLYRFLSSNNYEKSIDLKCDEKECFVLIDGLLSSTIENNLFKEKPTVYKADGNFDTISYKRLELENLESYDIVFEYSLDARGISKDMIVEVDNKVYLFNSFKNSVQEFDYLNDIRDYFDDNKKRVRDAF